MSSDPIQTTAPTWWSAEIAGGVSLSPESEHEAVETWKLGEFVLGISVIIHRGYESDA